VGRRRAARALEARRLAAAGVVHLTDQRVRRR
jgi:hypothetical protein